MSDCRQCVDFEWCAEHEDCGLFKPKTMTNAGRIRSMTDEELAEQIVKCRDADAFRQTVIGTRVHTVEEWLDWLQREAEQ